MDEDGTPEYLVEGYFLTSLPSPGFPITVAPVVDTVSLNGGDYLFPDHDFNGTVDGILTIADGDFSAGGQPIWGFNCSTRQTTSTLATCIQ